MGYRSEGKTVHNITNLTSIKLFILLPSQLCARMPLTSMVRASESLFSVLMSTIV